MNVWGLLAINPARYALRWLFVSAEERAMRAIPEREGSSCRRGTGCAYNIAVAFVGWSKMTAPPLRVMRPRGGRRWRWRQLARGRNGLTPYPADGGRLEEKVDPRGDLLRVTSNVFEDSWRKRGRKRSLRRFFSSSQQFVIFLLRF